MIGLKVDVDCKGITPQIVLAIVIVGSVYQKFGYDLTVTSLTDGTHGKKSLHYEGKAMDNRTRTVTPQDLDKLVAAIKEQLGPQFDVVLEGTNTPGATGQHLHVEFDPK